MASVKKTDETPQKEVLKEQEAKKSCSFSVYVGKTIVGAFNHITIFPCGVEEALKLPEVKIAMERYPEIKNQIVPGDELYKYN